MESIFERIERNFEQACAMSGMDEDRFEEPREALRRAVGRAREEAAMHDSYELVAVYEGDRGRLGSAQADFACRRAMDPDAFLGALRDAAAAGFALAGEDFPWNWGDLIEALYDERGGGPATDALKDRGIEPILEPDWLPATVVVTVWHDEEIAP